MNKKDTFECTAILNSANRLFKSGQLGAGEYFKTLMCLNYAFAVDHDMRTVLDLIEVCPLAYFKTDYQRQIAEDERFGQMCAIVRGQMVVYGMADDDTVPAPTMPAARRLRN